MLSFREMDRYYARKLMSRIFVQVAQSRALTNELITWAEFSLAVPASLGSQNNRPFPAEAMALPLASPAVNPTLAECGGAPQVPSRQQRGGDVRGCRGEEIQWEGCCALCSALGERWVWCCCSLDHTELCVVTSVKRQYR